MLHLTPSLSPRTLAQPAVAAAGTSAPRRNGAVAASAPTTVTRPRYSVSSNGPMAFTVQSYLMADTSAMMLQASSVHHAHAAPRRNAVAAMAPPISPNTAQYKPYIRNKTSMYLAVIGAERVSSDQDPLEKPS